MLTAALVLALAVLAIFPLLVVLAAVFLCLVVLHRMNQTQRVALEHMDKMARKVCAMSEKPTAQQVAVMETASRLSDEQPQVSPFGEDQMVQ